MQTNIKFIIHSHMTMKNNANLQSHGRPSRFATWVTATTPLTYNRLATIEFEDPTILQQRYNDGLTDLYFVILAEQYKDDLMLSLWIAQELSGFVVALQYRSSPELELSEQYIAFTCERKLTEAEIKSIFEGIFANPSVLDPVEIGPGKDDKRDTQKSPA